MSFKIRQSGHVEKADIIDVVNRIVEEATNPKVKKENEKSKPENKGKNPNAVTLGRLGDLKNGPARAKKLTKEQRSEAARRAAIALKKKVKKD